MKLRKIFLLIFGLVVSSVSLASCNKNNFVDYVHNDTNVRLRLDYKDFDGKNRNFLTDGISEVEVVTAIDGDTVHFRMIDVDDDTLIKGRFYGIDTPESTGQVQNWGATASNFTKTKLNEANTIVITSTSLDSYTPPAADSYGRYLTMVWISEKEDANYKDLVLLNLWIVQEGLSYVKNVGEFPEFSDIFYAAEQQARNLKLCLHSGKKEEGFNDGEYLTTSLLELKNAVAQSLIDPNYENPYNNVRVRVRGTVAGYANNILYIQYPFEDEDTGKITYAGINVFTGMQSLPSKYTEVNAFIELCALAQDSENFGFQLTSVHGFPKLSSDDPDDTKVIHKASETPEEFKVYTFEESAATIDTYHEALFLPIHVTDQVKVIDGYNSADGESRTLYCETLDGTETKFNIYVPFLYRPDSEEMTIYYTYEEFVGHVFDLTGIYTFHKSTSGNISYQIVPRDSNDLVLIS